MPVRVLVSVVMVSSCSQVVECSMIECLTGITLLVTLSSAQLFLVYTGCHGGTTLAHRGGTGRMALVHDWLPRAVHRRGRAASAGRRNAVGLLRDPGAAVGGPRARAADEPARRGGLGQQEPRLACGGPAGGTRLGPAGGLPHRPAWPGGRADRRGLRGAGRERSRACRAGADVAVRRAHPGAGDTAQGPRRGDDRGVRRTPDPVVPARLPRQRRARRTGTRAGTGGLSRAAGARVTGAAGAASPSGPRSRPGPRPARAASRRARRPGPPRSGSGSASPWPPPSRLPAP